MLYPLIAAISARLSLPIPAVLVAAILAITQEERAWTRGRLAPGLLTALRCAIAHPADTVSHQTFPKSSRYR